MIAEALIWTGIALAAPLVVDRAWDWLSSRLGHWSQPVADAGRWVYHLGIPYIALITGAVAARDMGVTGMTGVEWLRGGIVCAGVIGVAWIALGLRRVELSYAGWGQAAMDEPRWALYRGAASLWADPLWAGPLLGLGVGLLEWILWLQPWAQRARPAPAEWTNLVRVCGSTLLFLLTRNLWLIVLTQACLSLLLSRSAQTSAEEAA
jgi:hypothetical protein